MSNTLALILLAVGSYIFGNINWALIISKFKKSDIRKMGSGNPGTLNMSRNFGLGLGLLTFFLDILKGALPTLLAYFLLKERVFNNGFPVWEFAIYLCGFCAVIGHIYPVFLKFKGGKGIASTIGVFLVTESVHGIGWAIIIIMALVAALLFIYFTEFGAMGSFIAITPPAVAGSIRLFMYYGQNYIGLTDLTGTTFVFYLICNMLILAICFFTWFAHRKNIERMLAGDEHPTSIKLMIVKMKMKKKEQSLQLEKENETPKISIKDIEEQQEEK